MFCVFGVRAILANERKSIYLVEAKNKQTIKHVPPSRRDQPEWFMLRHFIKKKKTKFGILI